MTADAIDSPATTSQGVVRLPARFAYRATDNTATTRDTERYPALEVHFALADDGTPMIVRIDIPDGATPAQLRVVPWQLIHDRAVAYHLVKSYFGDRADDVTAVEWSQQYVVAHAEARTMRRRRNRVTDDFLQSVVARYTSGSRIDEIAEELSVSRRQVDRYLSRAREREMLR